MLSYVGTYDFICNHIGNEMWLEALEWTGKKGYNDAQLVDWKVDGKVAGSYKTSGPLSVSCSPLDLVYELIEAPQDCRSRPHGSVRQACASFSYA